MSGPKSTQSENGPGGLRPWELAEEIVDLRAENAALRADTERLDWLDRNLTSRDSMQTFEKEVLIGELRQAIDAAMRKERKP